MSTNRDSKWSTYVIATSRHKPNGLAHFLCPCSALSCHEVLLHWLWSPHKILPSNKMQIDRSPKKRTRITLKKQSSDPAREPTTAINVRKRQSNMICIQNPKIHIEVKCKQLRQRVPVHLQWTSVISVYLSLCAWWFNGKHYTTMKSERHLTHTPVQWGPQSADGASLVVMQSLEMPPTCLQEMVFYYHVEKVLHSHTGTLP